MSNLLKNIVPVVAVDGFSGVGKGTLCLKLQNLLLGWHFLDSGAIYRSLAVYLLTHNIACNTQTLISASRNLNLTFKQNQILLDGKDITQEIRGNDIANLASKIAANLELRAELVMLQRNFQKLPGLIADGRDMGSVIFPDATLKFFLTANPLVRAKRRCLQLLNIDNENEIDSKFLDEIYCSLKERDDRDVNRAVSPLKPALDAIVIDSTDLTIEEVFMVAKQHIIDKGLL